MIEVTPGRVRAFYVFFRCAHGPADDREVQDGVVFAVQHGRERSGGGSSFVPRGDHAAGGEDAFPASGASLGSPDFGRLGSRGRWITRLAGPGVAGHQLLPGVSIAFVVVVVRCLHRTQPRPSGRRMACFDSAVSRGGQALRQRPRARRHGDRADTCARRFRGMSPKRFPQGGPRRAPIIPIGIYVPGFWNSQVGPDIPTRGSKPR